MLEGRRANLEFASMAVSFLSQARTPCIVFDLDAFYSANSDRILSPLDQATAESTIIRVPEPGSNIELEFSRLFEMPQKIVIIDSLNSLYHLISFEDGNSRNRKLTFALAGLSYLARTNEIAVILTMYRREGFLRGGTGRSISALSDSTASVDVRDEMIRIRVERGTAWPGDAFSSRIPSE